MTHLFKMTFMTITGDLMAANPLHSESISAQMLVERAKELTPLFKKNAAEAERNRRTSEENIQALDQAGIFQLMVPRRYGGFQGSIRSHLEVSAAIAEACGGTAWVTSLINVCAWLTSLYPTATQDEIWGKNPKARLAGVFAPATDVKRVDGGLRVSGKWYWSSGCLHADWAILGVLEKNERGEFVDQYLALIPVSELSIEDTWFTVGMRASGSNCFVAKDVFVPQHRLMSLTRAIHGTYPTEKKDEVEYRAAFVPVASLILIGPQLGLGRAALQLVLDAAPKRAISYTNYQRQIDSVGFQMQVAEAALKIDTAHLHAFRAADDIDSTAARGEYLEPKLRARVRADTGVTAKSITQAIDILLTAHGAGSFAESNPLQRIWRDSSTAARHAIVLPPVSMEVYGRALLGLPTDAVTPLV